MASREGQGMQIAVILFALVTVVLAIFTYIFYQESNKLGDQLKQAQDTAANNDKGQKLAQYRLTALKYTRGEATLPDVDAAKNSAGGTEDPDVKKSIDQYKGDMALIGDDPNAPKENYITLVNQLLNTINKKNVSVTETQNAANALQQQKDQELKDALAAKKKAEDDLQAAIAAYNAAKQTLSDQLAQATREKDTLKAQFEEAKKTLDASVTDLNNKLTQKDKEITTLLSSFSIAQTQLEELRSDQGANFDSPDGRINWINQRQRLTWINLGSADGLSRQMTFSVFSQEQASAFKIKEKARTEGEGTERVATLDAKGRIEVVRILGAHEAECRILEDSPANPILPGDWIQTPAWSPGQHFGFALAGPMDVDGDGLDDTELIKSLIRINGGTIDAELADDGTISGQITARTRYFVEGKLPTEDAAGGDVKNILKGLGTMENQRKNNGVEKISVGELLDRMGWKPEEKTIGLGGRSDVGSGQFRRRTPGGKAAAPAESPMPMSPATPATPTPAPTDPFGTK
jgi:hypothetical protein